MQPSSVRVRPIVRNSAARLAAAFPGGVVAIDPPAQSELIEKRARWTQKHGAKPLWDGYREIRRGESEAWGNGARSSDQVRTRPQIGACLARIVGVLRPDTVVEFGTAFGVSGMYFLSALEANGRGRLFTFDPNAVWREIALRNLAAISDRFTSTLGTFEAECDRVLDGRRIDVAFVDAIHTADFVYAQVDLLKRRMEPGGVLILDDLTFAPDMRACWEDLSRRDDVMDSFRIGARVGVIELA